MVRLLRQRAKRMERMLEHRQSLVEEAQRQLAEQQRWVATCEAVLAQLAASQRSLAAGLAQLANRSVDAEILAGAETYESWLEQRRAEEAARLEQAKHRAELARAALIAQRREAKKLELVRARWLSEAQRREQAAEAALLDELATVRAARRLLTDQ
jgi:flagellar export protein FliJ